MGEGEEDALVKGEKSHARSTAIEPATKISTFCCVWGAIGAFGAVFSGRNGVDDEIAGINEILLIN